MLELVFIQGSNRGKVVPLNFQRAHFGRQPTCEFVLEGEELSRVHFTIERRGIFSVLIDNKSTNGTFVNRLPVTEATLRAGDQINVGTHVILVREASADQAGFRFVVEWKGVEGGVQVFQRNTLLIGRHNSCHVQLNEPTVAVVHAELEHRPDGLWITDRSADAGLYVNEKRIVKEQLFDGDRVRIRPFEITVGVSGEMCMLTLQQVTDEPVSKQFKVSKTYEKVLPKKKPAGEVRPGDAIAARPDYIQDKAPIWVPTSDILPNKFRSRMLLGALVLVLAFAAFAFGARKRSYVIPGPTSKYHSPDNETFVQQTEAFGISSQCAACHTAFARVRSDECQKCHADLQPVPAKNDVHAGFTCTSCHAVHRGRNFEIGKDVADGCLNADCHATFHQKLKSVAGSNRPKMEKPIPVAAAFETAFQDYNVKSDDPMHTKHFAAFGNVDCKSCHDVDAPASPDPKNPQKADVLVKARSEMRMKCLACHGFGSEATLKMRCYTCHFEHKSDAASVLKPAPLVSENRASIAGYGSGILLFFATLGTVPLLYFGIMVAGYRLEHWSFNSKTMAFLRERKLVSPHDFEEKILAARKDAERKEAERKEAEKLEAQRREEEKLKTGQPAKSEDVVSTKRPVIDLNLCVGCATCVHVCPFNVLEMVEEKAKAVRIDDCTGVAACALECPTEAIKMVDGGPLRKVELPFYGSDLETNVPGLYLAGEVTGKALIKVAINQGRKVIDSIVQNRPAPIEGGHDVIVIGAGPAGVSTGLAAKQEGLEVLVLEQGNFGNTIRSYPRQKFVMAEPVMIPVYGPLFMEDTSKETLLQKWEDIVEKTGLRIMQEEKVLGVSKPADYFVVKTAKGEYKGSRVVIAIGRRGTPRKLGVPGEDSAKVTYSLSDAEAYNGKAICIVGSGDSGIEAANGLARATLQNRVWLVNRGKDFARAKPRNQKKLQKAIEEGRIKIFYEANVVEIGANTISVKTPQGVEVVDNDFVFVMAGGEPPKKFLTQCGIEFSERPLV